jgi:hypothetical protein
LRPAEWETWTSAGEWRNEIEASARMSDDLPKLGAGPEAGEAVPRELPPAARRAVAEAEARRAQSKPEAPNELNGRGGLDPARYGDWEVKGLASDF